MRIILAHTSVLPSIVPSDHPGIAMHTVGVGTLRRADTRGNRRGCGLLQLRSERMSGVMETHGKLHSFQTPR